MNLSILKRNIINILGFRTNRKIVIIESDDWGSIRMPSIEVYKKLKSNGYSVDKRQYERLDSLESEDDLNMLFDILVKFKDSTGNPPIITANSVVTNPDFEKIKEFSFTKYFYETSKDTFIKYKGREKSFDIIKKGIRSHLFRPQFHGREHFNIPLWMKELKRGNIDYLYAFENKMCGIFPKSNPNHGNILLSALRYDDIDSKVDRLNSIQEGLNIFKDMYGYNSLTFIAPCYTWDDEIEKILYENGVKLIQSSLYQTNSNYKIRGKYHYMGQYNRFNMRYLLRNCTFEPSLLGINDAVDLCLSQIDTAFRWQKPAIISSHRINYCGSINKKNRYINLLLLNKLLKKIVLKYSNIEFMSSDMLYEIMK